MIQAASLISASEAAHSGQSSSVELRRIDRPAAIGVTQIIDSLESRNENGPQIALNWTSETILQRCERFLVKAVDSPPET